MDTYTAKDIKILNQEESDTFEFSHVLRLMEKYPNRSPENIKIGIEACRRVNAPKDYFEDYYLKQDPTVKYIPEVSEVFKIIQDENRLR